MQSRTRWLLLGVAAIAIGAVVLATCRRDETPADRRREPSSDSANPGTTHRPRRGGAASDGDATKPGAAAADAADTAYPREDEGFPFVDVEVANHDGSVVSNAAIAYALCAGTTTETEPPNVNVTDGRCRLHVLRPGRYDVGAVDGGFAALATDVDIPHAGPVRIVLPEPAELVLIGDPPLGPDDAAWTAADFRAEAIGENLASFPGRGQAIRWALGGGVEQSKTARAVAVPKGGTGRVRFESHDVAAVPGTFTAPATLHVVRAGAYPLTLRVAFESTGVTYTHDAVLRAEFFVGDAAEPSGQWQATIAGRRSVGTIVATPFTVRANANVPEGTIRWKGAGVAPGEQPFGGLVRGAENAVELTIRLLPDAPGPATSGAEWWSGGAPPTSVRVAGGDGAGLPAQARVFVGNAHGAFAAAEPVAGESAKLNVPDARWALATRGTWAADPVRIEEQARAADVALTLRPGGWLVLAVERRPPESLGEISIRRKDGAPILTQDGAQPVLSAHIAQAAILGPFPEGGVDFVLELCGEIVDEVHANVRAGAREKLKIPSVAPR